MAMDASGCHISASELPCVAWVGFWSRLRLPAAAEAGHRQHVDD